MNEINLNEIEKKELNIKQNRLKALIDIELLVDSAAADSNVNIDRIVDFSINEKNELFLDIINSLNIDDFDEVFVDGDSVVNCTIENTLDHVINSDDNKILSAIYDEFVFVLANYDITDLIELGIIQNYLKLINNSVLCYDEIHLVDCKMNN